MSTSLHASNPLNGVLDRLITLQRESVDRLALREAVERARDARGQDALNAVSRHLQVRAPRWTDIPDAANLPALALAPDDRWGILRGHGSTGRWVIEFQSADGRWQETSPESLEGFAFALIRLQPPYRVGRSAVLRIILEEMLNHRGVLAEAAVGGALIAVLAMLTSFYSMQVFDRVIPSAAAQTLLVLTLGVLASIAFEFLARRVRSSLYETLIDRVDQRLARVVYLRFLAVRLDQMPASVGTLAGQLRGYETVRSFLVGATTQMLVDAPFAFLFAVVIASIAGPLAIVPLTFLGLAILVGLWQVGRVRALTAQGTLAANRRTGLLVETVEGAEIIKSGQGGWRMLNRWLSDTDEARDVDLQIRTLSERSQHLMSAFQQTAYVLVMAGGALMVLRTELTAGALMACAMLSGRVLGPVTQFSLHLVSWGHAKAALRGLDQLWALEDDHHGQETPVVLEHVRGNYCFEQVELRMDGRTALRLARLNISAGERVGVIGPVGAGKTSLLRLLSGMYKPQSGRVLIDNVDLSCVAKPVLAAQVGYLPQDGRLLAGTLRDNLTLGLIDPGDEAILLAARRTGLLEAVIAPHAKGLEQEIREGGSGLSGGQRQLVNLTRVFLRSPTVWLLDEPSASLDTGLEQRVIAALKEALRPADSLVLVTHKPDLLALVDRLIVIANHQIVLDGPRDAVLKRLKSDAVPDEALAGVAA